jgi:hypothetical protein
MYLKVGRHLVHTTLQMAGKKTPLLSCIQSPQMPGALAAAGGYDVSE